MGKMWDKMIDHPIATWFTVGVLTDAAVRIINVVKGNKGEPITVNVTHNEPEAK